MTEQDIIDLGFEKQYCDGEEYYYTLDIGSNEYPSQNICLITCSNKERKGEEWHVEIFDYTAIRFDDVSQLKSLIELLNNNTTK
jgi:hypothetical protein